MTTKKLKKASPKGGVKPKTEKKRVTFADEVLKYLEEGKDLASLDQKELPATLAKLVMEDKASLVSVPIPLLNSVYLEVPKLEPKSEDLTKISEQDLASLQAFGGSANTLTSSLGSLTKRYMNLERQQEQIEAELEKTRAEMDNIAAQAKEADSVVEAFMSFLSFKYIISSGTVIFETGEIQRKDAKEKKE